MSAFDETLHPRHRSGQFAEKTNSAPAVGLTATVPPRPYAEQWSGGADAMIAGETNPWLQGSDGNPVDLSGGVARSAQPHADGGDCECFDGPVPGALVAMDTPEGIQRCDACQRFDSDLDAARAVASALSAESGAELSVWFTPAADPASGRVRQRSDGRLEVADETSADAAYGCRLDDWCVLSDGHDGDCNEDREVWAGADELYPVEKTPAEHLSEYEKPRPEDEAEALEAATDAAWGEEVDPAEVARRARVIAELRAPERMWADGIAHPGDEIFEAMWTTGEGGHGEADCRQQVERYQQMRADLAAGRMRPRDVIGTGYRGDTRKLANEWIDQQQASFERALETRGRSLSVNASNVRYRLRNAT